ncbi:Gfo/Idh/MocA family protein [Oceaniglobus trochenteri]|uniref:Gfo/Idh/MocA family protein n=1 Tax=Oceaniglobus trochenteri TaxID=2763260 RepID=UPI001CFFC48E|nr:Gfo/Idh/MocA family oxidoreductase [Oceaniglobus trochenteri]
MARRVHIIGAGAIAHHHADAARLLGLPFAACDPGASALEAFAAAFPEARTYADVDAMLANARDGDIAVVAVPPKLHVAMAQKAFAAGLHVVCEKPVVRDGAELDELTGAACAADRRLVDASVRFTGLPSQERARALLNEGVVGTPYLVRMVNRRNRARPGVEYQPTSRWFINRDAAGGGVLMDWGVYDLTQLFHVLRPVAAEVLCATAKSVQTGADPEDVAIEVESHVAATLRLTLPGDEAVDFIYERANGCHGPELSELTVEGNRGALAWQWLPPYPEGAITVDLWRDDAGKMIRETETLPMGAHPHFHHVPLHAMHDALEGGAQDRVDLSRIAFNFAVIQAIYRTAESGRPTQVALTPGGAG